MLDARFRPMPKWTRKPSLGWVRSHFKTPYNKTLDLLEYELRKLGATDIIIEAGYALDAIRNDGWPRGGRSPAHPGVVLYFKSKDGPMEFPCGTYEDMEANIHAIALTLENLRAIDRYGVTLGHQQYLGFLAIDAPRQMTVEDAAALLSVPDAGLTPARIIGDLDSYRSAYRAIASRVHPDAPGASQDEWNRVQQARSILDLHHGLTKTM